MISFNDDDVDRDEYYEGDDDIIDDGIVYIFKNSLYVKSFYIKFFSPGLALNSEQKVWDGAQGTGVKMLKSNDEAPQFSPCFNFPLIYTF